MASTQTQTAAKVETSNGYKDAARLRKVIALADLLEGRMPVSFVEECGPQEWERIAFVAGVRTPSAETIAMVIARLKERAAPAPVAVVCCGQCQFEDIDGCRCSLTDGRHCETHERCFAPEVATAPTPINPATGKPMLLTAPKFCPTCEGVIDTPGCDPIYLCTCPAGDIPTGRVPTPDQRRTGDASGVAPADCAGNASQARAAGSSPASSTMTDHAIDCDCDPLQCPAQFARAHRAMAEAEREAETKRRSRHFGRFGYGRRRGTR